MAGLRKEDPTISGFSFALLPLVLPLSLWDRSSGPPRLGDCSLTFQAFSSQPGVPERGRSPALCIPSPPATQGLGLQLSATPIPFPHPLGLPTSRLQDSGLLKTEKSTSQHVFHFGFANAALSRPPTLPASIHFSSFILYPLSCLLSCILASRGPWSLIPILQISWSSHLIASLSLAHGFGVLSWVVSHFRPGISKAPFVPS